MFGSKPGFSTPAFGTGGAFGTNFGTSTAAQQPGTGLFGAKPTVSFGATSQPQTTSLFGTPAITAAGAYTGSLFGGSNTFNTPSTGTLFGASNQPKPLFGATSTPFGQQQTSNAGFTFGSNTAGGLFGAQGTSQAQQQPQQQMGTTSLFGASTSSLFGSATAAPVGTTVKFNPKVDNDTMLKNNITQSIQTKHQCITAMKEYETKCQEELRTEDYLANRKGGTAPQANFAFASTLTQQQQPVAQGGLFGASATTSANALFGAQQNKPLFGGTTFGTATTASTGSLFGQPLQSTSLFGAGRPAFGATTTTAPNATFSFSTPAASAPSLFGQQMQPAFGAATQQQPSIFGAAPQQAVAPFGTQPGLAFAQPQGQNLFGSTPFAPASNALTAFGQQQPASNFGANIFGAKPATTTAPAFGGFGANTNSFGATGFGGFGQPSQPSIFGAAQQQRPAFGGFSTQPGTFVGAAPASNNLFGTAGFGQPGSIFGAQQAKSGLNFGASGGLGFPSVGFGPTPAFNQADMSQASGFRTQQALMQSQLLGMATSPYGDGPLLKLMHSAKRDETLPAPTDPIAQKRLMEAKKSVILPGTSPASKPLPPFKPMSKFVLSASDYAKPQEKSSGFADLNADTITFTDGFVPKKNIKKLVMKPKHEPAIEQRSSKRLFDSGNTSLMDSRPVTVPSRSRTHGDDSDIPRLDLNATADDHEISNRNIARPSSTISNDSVAASSPNQSSNTHATNENSQQTSELYPRLKESPPNRSNLIDFNQTSSVEDENVQQQNVPHPAGIILTRSDYFTIPSMAELANAVEANGDCVVDDFTVGRTGYGSVFWPGDTNAAGLNLDELIHFRHKEVTVYPDDAKKPPVGSGLNKKAEVTLERVWPIDKNSRLPIKDLKRLELMKYREKLEKATAQMDAEFIDYRPDTGSWVFRVSHFSKYGLAEEADEEEPSVMELEMTQQELPMQDKVQRLKTPLVIKNAAAVQRSVVDVGFCLDADAKGLGGQPDESMMVDGKGLAVDDTIDEEFEKPQEVTDLACALDRTTRSFYSDYVSGLRASFFPEKQHSPSGALLSSEETMESMVAEAAERSMIRHSRSKKKSLYVDLFERSVNLLGAKEMNSTVIDLSQPLDASFGQSPYALVSTETLHVKQPRRTAALVPHSKSFANSRHKFWFDASLFHGRRFRSGWVSTGTFLTKCSQVAFDTGKSVQRTRFFGTEIDVEASEFSVSVLSIPNHQDVVPQDAQQVLLKCQQRLSEKEHHGKGCHRFVPCDDGIEAINAYVAASKGLGHDIIASQVFELCQALWSKCEGGTTREDLLSTWITEQCRVTVDEEVQNAKRKGREHYIDGVFSLLTARRTVEAADLAHESGDFRLSLLIGSMFEITPESQALCMKQLLHWLETQADRYIDTVYLKIYTLAAGILSWTTSDRRVIHVYENLDWKRTFGLHLWYPCVSIDRTLQRYESNWRDEKDTPTATQPLPSYIECNSLLREKHRIWNEENDGRIKLDVCFHLIRLYVDRSYPIDTVLEPATWTSDPLAFDISWHLWCVLSSSNLVICECGRLDTLHAQYALQLERGALWHWAVFVALHIQDENRREAVVKRILSHNVWRCSDEELTFVTEEISVPTNWIFEQKALWARATGDAMSETWYLLKAGCYNLAHVRFLDYVGPWCIVNEDHSRMEPYVHHLSAHSGEIAGWSIGGQIFFDYLTVCSKAKSCLKDGGDVSTQMAQLRPTLLSLASHVSALNCTTELQKLCQGEMSVRTTKLLRLLLNDDQYMGMADVFAALPMPDDYLLDELKTLTDTAITFFDERV